MLNEDEVRDLLRKAGNTVHVDTSAPVAVLPVARRPWLAAGGTLAVAAAVVAVFVAVAVSRDSGDRSDGPTPVVTPTFPVNPRFSADQIPSVFAHTQETATALLTRAGLRVTIQMKETCEEVGGRALETQPSTGRRFSSGDPVTLVIAQSPVGARCAYEPRTLAWEFMDFANGRGPAPAFADEVTVYVNGGQPWSLDAEDAEQLAGWGDLPVILTERSVEVQRWQSGDQVEWHTPGLGVLRDDGNDFACDGHETPTPLRVRPSLMLSLQIPNEGPQFDCLMVNLYRTGDLIDAVVLRATVRPEPEPVSVPNVLGQPGPQAAAALEEAGFALRIEAQGGCARRGLVLSQVPESGTMALPGSEVQLMICRSTDTSADADGVGKNFLAFARGASTLDRTIFAEQIDLYLGNRLMTSVSAAAAYQPEAWEVCPERGYAEASCPFSVVAVLDQHVGPVVYTARHPQIGACAEALDGQPPDTATPRFVVVGVAEPRTCLENFAIELYYRDDGLIGAVNLLLGSP